MIISRRSAFCGTTALTAAVLLAGCGAISSNTVNGVTTVTINVAQLTNWGQAIINAGTLLAPAAGPTGALILAAANAAEADFGSLATLAGGSVELSFDSTSVPNAVSSLLADGQTIVTDAVSAIGATTDATIQNYLTAAKTIVSIFKAALTPAGNASAVPLAMTEAKALATLKVQ